VRRFIPEHTPVPALAAGTAGIVVPGALLGFMAHKQVHIGGWPHFLGVGCTAVVATAAAVALTIAGARRGDGRTVLLGTAFTVMAALLALHGLATPGIILPYNGLVGFTGAATLPIGGAVLALSALPSLRRPRGITRLLVLQGALVAAIVGLGTWGMLEPEILNGIPEPGDSIALGALAVACLFYGVLILRALRTFLLTRRRGDLAVVVGVAWLTAAVPPAMLFTYLDLGWWLGHAFELVGIVLVGIPVAADLRRAAESRPLSGDLSAAELVAKEEAYLGSQVRALTQRLADKDGSTEEHTRRVALRAVQVGEDLGLPAHRLRDLAIGGLLHDIGKLSVPDRILKKPAPLTDDEFGVIKRHPELGRKLLGELGGFAESVRRLVLDHHERLAGDGYPRGLQSGELQLDTRILTVCDVYDALISPRVYREAWTHEQAIALLREEAGTAFDPRCVSALERVLAREHAAGLAVAV
jgi:HD domain